jgi:hypothetical protein
LFWGIFSFVVAVLLYDVIERHITQSQFVLTSIRDLAEAVALLAAERPPRASHVSYEQFVDQIRSQRAAVATPAPMADRGSTEKLLEVYPFCLNAVQTLLTQLNDYIGRVSHRDDQRLSASITQPVMIAELVADYVRTPLTDGLRSLERLMERRTGLTETEFQERIAALQGLLCNEYETGWCWFVRLGLIAHTLTEEVLMSSEYRRAYAAHAEMLPELRRIQNRTDLGAIANCLGVWGNKIRPPLDV